MFGQFLLAGAAYDQRLALPDLAIGADLRAGGGVRFDHQAVLAARHGHGNVGQQVGVDQGGQFGKDSAPLLPHLRRYVGACLGLRARLFPCLIVLPEALDIGDDAVEFAPHGLNQSRNMAWIDSGVLACGFERGRRGDELERRPGRVHLARAAVLQRLVVGVQ